MLSVSGQNIKLINENEFRTLTNKLLNPDNVLEEYSYRQTNVTTFDYTFRKKTHSIFLDLKIVASYSDIDRTQLGLKSKQKSFFNYDPIELYYKLYKGNFTFFVGRKKVSFGVGYVANPTDFISLPTQFDDSNDRLYRILGNELVQVSFTGNSWQTDVYLLPKTEQNTRVYYDNYSVASRIYKYFNAIDIGLLGRVDLSGNYKIGFNSTYTINQKIEFHTEAILQNRNNISYINNGELFTKNNINSQILIGGQYSTNTDLNFVFEYFNLSQGLNKDEWGALYNQIQNARLAYQSPFKKVSSKGIASLIALNDLILFPVRKNYIFFRAAKSKIKNNFELEYLTFIAIDEATVLHRIGLVYESNKKFSLYGQFQFVTNTQGTSFATLNYNSNLRFGINYNFSLNKKQ